MSFLKDISEFGGESQSKTTIEMVYEALRSAILSGEITPESRLRVEVLRKTFGVGASTVREALSRLLVENLVTTEGQRGFRAALVSVEDFKNIVDMRALLEAKAVRESIAKGDDEWESAFVAAHHRLAKIETEMEGREEQSVQEWEVRNRAFHNAMIGACTNGWLLNFREILYSHSIRYLQIAITDRSIPRDVRAEHQAIFDAVIARDADLAEKLTVDHILRSVPVIEARVSALEAEH
ncbi:GntR family transcriptional regulator [Thalassovita sp.]|uniref:GntR family transcriptional regulator n=1 Tax=Thalassovita sp. TaxID=1979401 RepID=UPI002881938B|nr:FCD domain-containing protein [Thalassovita sp.]MDF1802084.1 FCD domain-containing protein [Thalassovita sp.]